MLDNNVKILHILKCGALGGAKRRAPMTEAGETKREVISRIKELMFRKRMDQPALAEATLINVASINRILNNKQGLSLEHLIKIAKALEVELSDLLPSSDEKESLDERIKRIYQKEIDRILSEREAPSSPGQTA